MPILWEETQLRWDSRDLSEISMTYGVSGISGRIRGFDSLSYNMEVNNRYPRKFGVLIHCGQTRTTSIIGSTSPVIDPARHQNTCNLILLLMSPQTSRTMRKPLANLGEVPANVRDEVRNTVDIGNCPCQSVLLVEHLHPWPPHAARCVRPGAAVVVLGVEERVQREVPLPRHVAIRIDEISQLGFHKDCAGILFPRSGEVAANDGLVGGEGGLGGDAAVLEDVYGVLEADGSAMCCDDVLLVIEGAADDDKAVLEDGRGVAEDEVHGACDDAAAVELVVSLGVEGVLIAFHAAVEDDGVVGLDAEGDGLVLLGTGSVSEAHSDEHQAEAGGGWIFFFGKN
ncbi:hypothetical protein IEQ34_019338 [Dendrobium chrysotoxum]|uniref:Uncharacterized protein n=1 Tax=Dendrobium chrysotoxum TaxID=161865 RepID=A0AAV7FR54_DENCH|nr:hypothetical protein IEQ34_019338 [Dendrobium chrysotoxum]